MFHSLNKNHTQSQPDIMWMFHDPNPNRVPLSFDEVTKKIQGAKKVVVVNLELYGDYAIGRADLLRALVDLSKGEFKPNKKIDITIHTQLTSTLSSAMSSFRKKCATDPLQDNFDFLTFMVLLDEQAPTLDNPNDTAFVNTLLTYLSDPKLRFGFARIASVSPELTLFDDLNIHFSINAIAFTQSTVQMLNQITSAVTNNNWVFYEKHATALIACDSDSANKIVAHLQAAGIHDVSFKKHRDKPDQFYVQINPVSKLDKRLDSILAMERVTASNTATNSTSSTLSTAESEPLDRSTNKSM